MGEVVRGTMDAEGNAEWANEPMKPTWEQVVAMQKESAALRAQAAAVLPTLAAGVTPRSRRAPSRNEYPLFIPSYRDPPLLSGSQQMYLSESLQGPNLGNPAPPGEDSFRGRLLERRPNFGPSDFRAEIVAADSGNSATKPQPYGTSAVSRHVNSHRSQSLHRGLSPEISQLTGHTPKSAVSGKSDTTNAPITPASLHRNVQYLQEDAAGKGQFLLNPGETSRGPVVRQVRDIGHRHHADAASPTDASLWKGCSSSLSMVAPYLEGTSAAGSGMDASPQPQASRRPAPSRERARSQPQTGLFGFLPWGKKGPSNVGQSAKQQSSWERESSSTREMEKLIKTLQSQLEQAEKQRLTEVRELQSMLQDMQEKFEQLRAHCRNLERQMSKQTRHATRNNAQEYHVDQDDSSSLESGSVRAVWQRSIPHASITPDLFTSAYDEAVTGLRRLSRAICLHIREMGESASQVITAVLENHSIARGRLRKAQKILYFESFLNQIMFENFENVNFEPSGGASALDPEALQQLSFQSFQELQSVSWLDIEQTLDNGQGVIVSHTFHQFFLLRMDIVLHQLGDVGETTMPPTVISAFFDAIKAVWLLHHLAFSFRPAATILRASQGARFEHEYMDQVHESDRESRAKSVFLMINPGFLIDDWVVKCRVYCSSRK